MTLRDYKANAVADPAGPDRRRLARAARRLLARRRRVRAGGGPLQARSRVPDLHRVPLPFQFAREQKQAGKAEQAGACGAGGAV